MPEDVSISPVQTWLATAAHTAGADQPAPEDPEVEWRAEVGRGLQSPLIVHGSVLLAGASNRVVAAISTETGEHHWERRLDGAVTGGLLVTGRTIYAAGEESMAELVALELGRGRQRWDREVGSTGQSLLLVGDTLYVATDAGDIFSFSARDGERHWRVRLRAPIASAPFAFGPNLYLATGRDSLVTLARADGRAVEQRPFPRPSAPASQRGDTLLLAYHDGSIAAYRMPALEELWRAQTGAPITAAPIAADDGYVYALNAHAEVWRIAADGSAERIAAPGGAARASLSLARAGILVGRLDGTVLLLRRDGSEVWRREFDDAIVAPATAHAGAVYIPLLRGMVVKLR